MAGPRTLRRDLIQESEFSVAANRERADGAAFLPLIIGNFVYSIKKAAIRIGG